MNDLQIIKYQEDVEAVLDSDRKVWLTVNQICELLDLKERVIRHHIANWKDVDPDAANAGVQHLCIRTPAGERTAAHYNIDFIIYLAYRMNNKDVNERVIKFRRWVASIVDRYVRGDLRKQEQYDYQKVKDFIKQMSDYKPNSPEVSLYYATMQNKMLFAVTGMTAAELIKARANHRDANMGLQTWGDKNITLKDVTTGKNYLNERELQRLVKLVNMFDLGAEELGKRYSTMAQWLEYVDNIIVFTFSQVLIGTGKCSHADAEAHARREYSAYKRLLESGQ